MTLAKTLRAGVVACATLALVLATSPTFAHAKLLSEVPPAEDAANSSAETVPITQLHLAFSEALNAAFSRVEVRSSTGAVIDGATVALDPKNNKTLVVNFTSALPNGEYTVDWTAVSNDGHKTTGTYRVNVAE